MKYGKLMAGIGMINAVTIPLYFIAAYFGWWPVEEYVPGYTVWFWSFPLPDSWLVITSALLVYAIKAKRDTMAIVCGLLTASAGIFLGLNELMFILYTGMNIGVDIVFKIYFFSTGAFFIKQFTEIIGKSPAMKG